LIAVGAAAFLLFLYALGSGWGNERGGTAHATANGLDGFAGLVQLLEARGHPVSLTRRPDRLADPSVLVLTPQLGADGDEINRLIESRRYVGPTVLILPKWFATPAEDIPQLDAPKHWVWLSGTLAPNWLDAVAGLEPVELKLAERQRWSGMGVSGALASPESTLALTAASVPAGKADAVVPLVRAWGRAGGLPRRCWDLPDARPGSGSRPRQPIGPVTVAAGNRGRAGPAQ
jgi:hypothetical protein